MGGTIAMDQNAPKRLTEEKCYELYNEFDTPERVKRHCAAVSDAGVRIGEALNRSGMKLDIDLIKMSGLIHDVCRRQEDHGHVAARILESRGYTREADVVREHMYYDFNPIEKLNETDVMCLADRLVKEDQYVGLDERVDYLIKKRKQTEETKEMLLQKKAETEVYIKQLESIIGQSIDSLFGK